MKGGYEGLTSSDVVTRSNTCKRRSPSSRVGGVCCSWSYEQGWRNDDRRPAERIRPKKPCMSTGWLTPS